MKLLGLLLIVSVAGLACVEARSPVRRLYKNMGCFKDPGNKDLPYHAMGTGATREICFKACNAKGYKYFGLQYFGHCFCGNSYGRYGKLTKGHCNTKCKAATWQNCGGAWINNVFAIRVPEDNLPRHAHYKGCYKDSAVRDLPYHAMGTNATPYSCYKACRSKGYEFFGLQYHGHCFCGHSYGRHGKATTCNTKCTANKHFNCGGAWTNRVFATGLRVQKKERLPIKHIGCYKDAGTRDLQYHAMGTGATLETCYKACKGRGYQYMGLQYHGHCFCGHSYGLHGKLKRSACNTKCKSALSQNCGGAWINNVYSTGVPQEKLPRNAHYKGCYRDSAVRDLPHLAMTTKATPLVCYTACKKKGFQFFGLQFHGHCFCGHSYGRHGKSKNCNTKCKANRSFNCGGAWANRVYSTGLPVKKKERLPVKHIGCYKDAGTRDLQYHAMGTGATVENCYKACTARGYQYMGLQFHGHCFCGHSFGLHGALKKSACNTKCKSSLKQNCGGAWANNVYSTGIAQEKLPRNAHYKGCFKDSAVRDLPYHAMGTKATPLVCYKACRKMGYQFFGLQYYGHCFCGHSYGRHGRSKTCNTKCNSNRKFNCGGAWTNKVYTTGLPLEKLPESAKYLGCFKDAGIRDLPYHAMGSKATPASCNAKCLKKGYKFFGLQHHKHCFCGHSYGRYKATKASDCNTKCNNNSFYKCGGAWRNSVYRTGKYRKTSARRCRDFQTGRFYSKGKKWVTKHESFCSHYKCGSKKAIVEKVSCLDVKTKKCVLPTAAGVRFHCADTNENNCRCFKDKVHGTIIEYEEE